MNSPFSSLADMFRVSTSPPRPVTRRFVDDTGMYRPPTRPTTPPLFDGATTRRFVDDTGMRRPSTRPVAKTGFV